MLALASIVGTIVLAAIFGIVLVCLGDQQKQIAELRQSLMQLREGCYAEIEDVRKMCVRLEREFYDWRQEVN